jgi:hypothetical protein
VLLYLPALERKHRVDGKYQNPQMNLSFYEIHASKLGGAWQVSAELHAKVETYTAHLQSILGTGPLEAPDAPRPEISFMAGTSAFATDDGALHLMVLDDRHETVLRGNGDVELTTFEY